MAGRLWRGNSEPRADQKVSFNQRQQAAQTTLAGGLAWRARGRSSAV